MASIATVMSLLFHFCVFGGVCMSSVQEEVRLVSAV